MVNGFIILFGLTMLYLAATSRIIAHIRLLIVQGVLLFLICCCGAEHMNLLNFAFLTVETLIFKSIVIPAFLYKVLKKTHSNRDVAANIPHFYCLFIASIILLAGFLVSNYYVSSMKLISPIFFGVSVATIVISLWLITIKHKIIADISVSNLEPQINFELNWNNKSKNHLLQIRFNLENDINKTFSEDTIGIVEREFDPTYNIYDYIPAKKGIELKTNIAPMQRFVWAQNCGIVTKGLNEYEVYKNTLNLTLLRSTELISEPKNPCRGTPAGPPITCPDLQCLGQNYAKFCIRFCQKPSQLYQTAELFYGSIIPLFSQIENISPFNIKNSNILIQALKLDKQENLIIRLVNISNNDELLNLESKFKKVWICNSQEEILYPYKTAIKIKSKSLVTLKCQK